MAMDSSSSQSHRQEIGSQTLESMLIPRKAEPEKKPKPAEQALKCPRCDSTNTKFCYYNNYSLSQPRYFCKSCRRYWTKGGTLRNVPVGGGCRKTKRSSSKKSHDNQPIKLNPTPNIPLPYNSNIFTSGSQLGLDDPGFPISQDPNMPVSGFLENPLGFQNLYYGIGDGGNLGLEINGMGMGMGIEFGLNQEMGLVGFDEINGATTASTAVTTVKQEMCSGIGRDNGGLWGFPWQNVGGDGNMGESDLTKFGNWNGIGYASNWQGLLNSPLM